jgi:hypothetical protein
MESNYLWILLSSICYMVFEFFLAAIVLEGGDF